MPKVDSHRESFDGIQYLRGIAALMVVMHHARHYYGKVPTWSEFGGTGVDIFFIISGFIMVHATRNLNPDTSRRQQAIDFFARRAIRIIPLYWLALLFKNRHNIGQGNLESSVLNDFLFIPRFNPSFDGDIFPSLIVGWTLNFEMFFYVLFGLSILFGPRKYLALVLAILALVTIGKIWRFDDAILIFWTGSMLGEFALGIGVYLIFAQKKWAPHPFIAFLLVTLGFIILAIPNGAVPRLIADGLPAALIVWSSLYIGSPGKSQRALRVLGDASYSIYLTHVLVLPHCYRIFNKLSLNEPAMTNVIVVLVLGSLACAIVGVIVYYLIERPLLKMMTALWQNRKRLPNAPLGA